MPGRARSRASAASRYARRSPRLLPSAINAVTGSAMGVFQIATGTGENVLVIERQPGRPGESEPRRLVGIVGGAWRNLVGIDARQIDDADDSAARIAARRPEC